MKFWQKLAIALGLAVLTGSILAYKKQSGNHVQQSASETASQSLDQFPAVTGAEKQDGPEAGQNAPEQAETSSLQAFKPGSQSSQADLQPAAKETSDDAISADEDLASMEYLKPRIALISKRYKSVRSFMQKLAVQWDDSWNKAKDNSAASEQKASRERESLFNYIAPLPKSIGEKAIRDLEKVQKDESYAFEAKQQKDLLKLQADTAKKYADLFTQQEQWRNEFLKANDAIWKDLKLKYASK